MFHRKRSSMLFTMAFLLCTGIAANLCEGAADLDRAQPIQRNLLGVNSIAKMETSGLFEVHVWQGDRWQHAGSLHYDKFFRDREIDITPCTTGTETVKLRLIQRGGGAAHIDCVRLGGKQPAEVNGQLEAAYLKKISEKDFDVVSASEETLDLIFPTSGTDKTLRVTARVEGLTISTTPFQFPSENLYRPISLRSKFYKYHLDAEKGALKIDGDLKEVGSRNPFFKEYSRSGSGHPSGYTYGWVRNDGDYLYVAMDFTPDNTMDGNKDYAKVYAKTDKGLKEFKVSVPETGWGSPGFTYTDKVSYQHKVYEFKIPLSEVGIAKGDRSKEIELAFAAYGTASPGDYFPSLCYDPNLNRSLVVYQKVIDTPSRDAYIFGQFMTRDGTPLGDEFPISVAEPNWKGYPVAAYDTANHRFLVVWEDGRNDSVTGLDIYGQIVNGDGTLSGGNFPVSDNNSSQTRPSLAYDSVNQRFLVVWQDGRNPYPSAQGQLVNGNGTLYGTASNENFPIADQNDQNPLAAYDGAAQKFLVIFNRYSGNFNIHGQVVNADGSLNGLTTDISTAEGNQYVNWYGSPIAYDSTNRRFLVVWEDDRSADHDIYGQLVNADGTPSGGESAISIETANQSFPAVDFDTANQRYLVAWHDWRNGVADIYGQFVGADGNLFDIDFVISDAADRQLFPAVVYNPGCQNFLVSYETEESGTGRDIGLAVVGAPCPVADTTPDPFTFLDRTGVGLLTAVESNPIVVSGINAASAVSIAGGEYEINGSGTWTAAAGTVNNNDTVRVRLTSSGSHSTTSSATLTIGGESGAFNVTTISEAPTPFPPSTGGGCFVSATTSASWSPATCWSILALLGACFGGVLIAKRKA